MNLSWGIRKTYQHMHNQYINRMLIIQAVQKWQWCTKYIVLLSELKAYSWLSQFVTLRIIAQFLFYNFPHGILIVCWFNFTKAIHDKVRKLGLANFKKTMKISKMDTHWCRYHIYFLSKVEILPKYIKSELKPM